MEIWLLIIGIILFLAGALINFAINRRRFNRRGPGGLQHFESYGKAVCVSVVEKLGKFIAILLILGGLLFIASYFLLPDVKREIERQQTVKPKGN